MGLSELEVEAATLGQLLGTLATRFPVFGQLVTAGRLDSSMAVNLNGDAFGSEEVESFLRRTPAAGSG